MPLVNLVGAYDLHVHTLPSLFSRSLTDVEMARHAADHGLVGILLKNHFESTVGRAQLAGDAVAGTHVYGSLTLNAFAGGINPAAVETALRLGAKEIFFPTVDAAGHVAVFGHAGGFGYQESGMKDDRPGIGVLTAGGQLTEPAKTVIKLVQEAGAILGTGHLSGEEIFAVSDFCKTEGFGKLLITHPYFNPPKLNVSQQAELTTAGAVIELCAGNLYPIPGTARLENYLETISTLGVESLIVSSDAGQPRKSLPGETLRIFTQCLMEKGIGQEMIDRLVKINPARLLEI
jgi:hypothetical protein